MLRQKISVRKIIEKIVQFSKEENQYLDKLR